MNILFIHQNFPGQFKNLAPALVTRGDRCVALTLSVKKATTWKGVHCVPYNIVRDQGRDTHPWLRDLDAKMIRAESCMRGAERLKAEGFEPDVIIGHPGWGELMFLRDVWPTARIGLFYEFYYQEEGADNAFDPEFANPEAHYAHMRMRMKNLNNSIHYPLGDMGVSPTRFQAHSFPPKFRDRIHVIHDGIDTEVAKPDHSTTLRVDDHLTVTKKDEVITFVNRNLEPYRGYHTFMRALPTLLKKRPNAQVLIVGGDSVSYGPAPTQGTSWKQLFIDEVRGRISTPHWQRVHFMGRIPYEQFIKLLQVSRVHIYLTYPFVLSWSLLEAMSCEAAIVASNTEPVREVISHQKNGVLTDFFDYIALVDQIDSILENPEQRIALGQAARASIIEQYDLKTVCLPQQIAWVDKLFSATAGTCQL